MRALLERILAAGGSFELNSKQHEDGALTAHVFIRFHQVGREGFGSTLDSALNAALERLAKDSVERAEKMAEESVAISEMVMAYSCPPVDASFEEVKS